MNRLPSFGLLPLVLACSFDAVAADSPYGRDVTRAWDSGHRLEKQGRFDAALAVYEKALGASASLAQPAVEAKQLAVLRECAAQGSRLRIAGARAGAAVIAKSGAAPTAKDRAKALDASREAFEAASRKEDEKRPELANACP